MDLQKPIHINIKRTIVLITSGLTVPLFAVPTLLAFLDSVLVGIILFVGFVLTCIVFVMVIKKRYSMVWPLVMVGGIMSLGISAFILFLLPSAGVLGAQESILLYAFALGPLPAILQVITYILVQELE